MKWLHNLLKGVSLNGALFVFHACYGISMPPLYEEGGQAPMSFLLVSHADGTPLEGIKVMELGKPESRNTPGLLSFLMECYH